MKSRPTFTLKSTAVAFAVLSVFMAMLAGKPRVAYNSAAREQLANSLQTIRAELDSQKKTAGLRPLPAKLTDAPPYLDNSAFWANRRIAIKWHIGDTYHNVLFVPVAFTPTFPSDESQRFPLIAMVPIGPVDTNASCRIHEYDEQLSEKEWLVYKTAMAKRLFEENHISDATVLLPDGSIRHISTSDLFSQPAIAP